MQKALKTNNQYDSYSEETLLKKCFAIHTIKRQVSPFKIHCDVHIYKKPHFDDFRDTSNLTETIPKI